MSKIPWSTGFSISDSCDQETKDIWNYVPLNESCMKVWSYLVGSNQDDGSTRDGGLTPKFKTVNSGRRGLTGTSQDGPSATVVKMREVIR
jgi:hypothetical protein